MSARTILIVEDSAMSLELVTDLLEVAGYRVLKAVTAEAGISVAADDQPDLILMDIALPGLDGIEAIGRLAQDSRTARIPVVALTAQVLDSERERVLAAGCRGVITKPIDTRNLARTVAGFIGGDATTKTVATGNGPGRG
jgi:two-component system cell cycle response regulator DivK